MRKNNENSLVPKLRFPEFHNDRNWENLTLGEIGEPLMCKRIFKEETTPNPFNGVPFYKIGTFGGAADSYIPIAVYEQYKSKYSFPNIGDILISASGTIGRLVIYDGSPAYFQDSNIIWLGHNEKTILNSFLFYSYANLKWQTSDGGVISRLYNSDFKRMKMFFPQNQNEQQKIASCLSSLDEVITAERQKLEVLKDHKKGLLQNLFPQLSELGFMRLEDGRIKQSTDNKILKSTNPKNPNSDNIPKFRFKEFEDRGEWVEKKLGEVFEFKVTNSFSRDCLNYQSGEVKNIHYGDIHTKFNTLFDISKEDVPFVNNDIAIEKIKEENYCREGDMIFADASEDLNDVGKSIEVINLNGEKLVSGLHTLLARQRENIFAIGFGGYLFKSDWIRKQIQREAQGAKVLGISSTRISNINIKFPKGKNEQQKIASCLSSLDELIIAQNQKIETLQLHKKGLLQGLFPNVSPP